MGCTALPQSTYNLSGPLPTAQLPRMRILRRSGKNPRRSYGHPRPRPTLSAPAGNSSVNGLLRNHGVIRGAFVSPVLPRIPPAQFAGNCGRVRPDLFRYHLRRRSDRPQTRNALPVLEINISVSSRHVFTPFQPAFLQKNKCKKQLSPFLHFLHLKYTTSHRRPTCRKDADRGRDCRAGCNQPD